MSLLTERSPGEADAQHDIRSAPYPRTDEGNPLRQTPPQRPEEDQHKSTRRPTRERGGRGKGVSTQAPEEGSTGPSG